MREQDQCPTIEGRKTSPKLILEAFRLAQATGQLIETKCFEPSLPPSLPPFPARSLARSLLLLALMYTKLFLGLGPRY